MDVLTRENKVIERMNRMTAITDKLANGSRAATNPIDKVLKTNEVITRLASAGDHIAHS